MAAFKDCIPVGNDNDSNSGDSWFVLSSASEEEDDEPEAKNSKPKQLEDSQKKRDEKKNNEPEEKHSKVKQLKNCRKETIEKMDEECKDEKPKTVELENCQKERNDEKDDHVDKKLKTAELENCQETDLDKENEHMEEQKKIQLENYQKETAGEKVTYNFQENEPVNKKPKMEPLENYQKEIAEEKLEKESKDKQITSKVETFQTETAGEKIRSLEKESKDKPITPKVETVQTETAGKKVKSEDEFLEKNSKRVQLEKCQNEITKEKEDELLEKDSKRVQVEKCQNEITKEKVNNEKSGSSTEQERKILQENVYEKPDMTKHRRKSKGLSTDEGSHSEIALEVHALRETLIQLSLNLSNTEQEKYTAIISEVQALREIVSQLNSDLSNRISQIETRSEQVHTLLCRFIMNRCGNYKEPKADKGHRPDTSNVAVQAETSDNMQTSKNALSVSSTTVTTQNISLNENTEVLPIASTSPQNGKIDDNTEPTGKVVKGLSIKTDIPSKEQSDSHGLKRPRSDGESNQAFKESSYSSETFEESSSYSSSVPARRDETNKFSKEKSHYNRYKPRHTKLQSDNYHNFRDTFHQYPPTHQTQSYGSNRELAELAYRYSSEKDRHWRKNTSNRSWQSGNHRKHPYFKQPLEGQDVCSSDPEMGKPVNEFSDGLDDYMDKVIDEWAQDEDF